MNRLPEIIGPAPSEMSKPELIAKLQLERDRVREGLHAFINQPPPKTKKQRKLSMTTQLKKVFEETGMTPEEFNKLLESGEIKL